MNFLSASAFSLFFFSCLSQYLFSHAQQPYINNMQLDCDQYRNLKTTNGYICNGPQKSCTSYLTFRAQPPYDSALSIGYLLNVEPSTIATTNSITDIEKIPTDTQILVPVNCSCSGGSFYQHNSSYTLKTEAENYFTLANDTYQGLTTCQAMENQNPLHDTRNLYKGLKVGVPLRCACPSTNQSATGVKFIVAYLVTWGDTLNKISATFGVDVESVIGANELSANPNLIFPFTPILVPVKTAPTKIKAASPPQQQQQKPPPPPPPVQVDPSAKGKSSDKRKWVFIGIGIGLVLFLLALLGTLLCCMLCYRRKGKTATKAEYTIGIPAKDSGPVSSDGIRLLIDSLTVYKIEELQRATGYFGDDHIIRGNVYRGLIRGDYAGIKKLGNVSSSTQSEINILKQINHSSIIRLSGYCVHQEEGNTYLVYEFAENGSLSEWLHDDKYKGSLEWKQRIQIAYDVADGLNYLHNYTNPPYVHKDLKSSNILLNGDFRAKMTNFGRARTVENGRAEEEDGSGGLHLTKHVVGTRGYMPPEYLENGVVTPKLDIFAFGVVMLELLSGKKPAMASGEGRELLLSATIKKVLEGENVRQKLKDFIDPSLEGNYPLDLAFSMASLAINCVAQDLNDRPNMDQVFVSLSKILSSSLDWDPSDEIAFSSSFNRSR